MTGGSDEPRKCWGTNKGFTAWLGSGVYIPRQDGILSTRLHVQPTLPAPQPRCCPSLSVNYRGYRPLPPVDTCWCDLSDLVASSLFLIGAHTCTARCRALAAVYVITLTAVAPAAVFNILRTLDIYWPTCGIVLRRGMLVLPDRCKV